MGYRADELVDQHHSLFTEPAYAASDAYRRFWSELRGGAAFTGEFKRLGKGGREVWFQASVLEQRRQARVVVAQHHSHKLQAAAQRLEVVSA